MVNPGQIGISDLATYEALKHFTGIPSRRPCEIQGNIQDIRHRLINN